MQRERVLRRMQREIAAHRPLIGAGAGTGLSAKCAEAGGADLLVIYNSGRYRMAGRGSLAGLLAYGNANDIVVDMAKEVLPVVDDTQCWQGATAPTRSCSPTGSSPNCATSASPESRTSPPSGSSTAPSAPTSKKPAWATSSKSN